MLMPMLLMLALMLMLLPNAFDAAAYAAADLQNADAKMRNDACHLAGCYVVRMLPTLLPLLSEVDDVMQMFVMFPHLVFNKKKCF